MKVGSEVHVIKQNSQGKEVWRYSGKVLCYTKTAILLEAYFNRSDLPFHGITLAEGDRFVEVYFSNRWYNIFEIHDKHTDGLKGWYCNVTAPAEFSNGTIAARDLALDLFVYPDGRQLILDEDEFADLELSEVENSHALTALQELQSLFKESAHFNIYQMVM
jgi:predicted RNA-binding protein associated with RNAse of E/G family